MDSVAVKGGRLVRKQEQARWVTIQGKKVRIGPKGTGEQVPASDDAMAHIKRTGTAQRGDVSVKIVRHLGGDGFAVETTVAGDRRYPTEEPMSVEEAQVFAVKQLKEPRAPYESKIEEEIAEPSKPAKPKRMPGLPSPEELVRQFKSRGIGRQESWSRFVQAMALKPGMDVKDWYEIYDKTAGGY